MVVVPLASLYDWLRSASGLIVVPQLSRAAWLGRCGNPAQRDARLALQSQLARCEAALPTGMEIVARFYDIAPSRKGRLAHGAARGAIEAAVGIPRDGGLADLLTEAMSPDRRFDALICQSIDRVSRYTDDLGQALDTLQRAGVTLLTVTAFGPPSPRPV